MSISPSTETLGEGQAEEEQGEGGESETGPKAGEEMGPQQLKMETCLYL